MTFLKNTAREKDFPSRHGSDKDTVSKRVGTSAGTEKQTNGTSPRAQEQPTHICKLKATSKVGGN